MRATYTPRTSWCLTVLVVCTAHMIKPGSSFFWTCDIAPSFGRFQACQCAVALLFRRWYAAVLLRLLVVTTHSHYFLTSFCGNIASFALAPGCHTAAASPTTAVTLINADSKSRKLGTGRSMPRCTYDTCCLQPLQRSTFFPWFRRACLPRIFHADPRPLETGALPPLGARRPGVISEEGCLPWNRRLVTASDVVLYNVLRVEPRRIVRRCSG